MRKVLAVSICVCFISTITWADTFGAGGNQFTIDFVNIAGDSGNLGNWYAGNDNSYNYFFSGVNHSNYRIGTYEITEKQLYKYRSPTTVGDATPCTVTYNDAAKFVNWLNVSTGHQAAYKFTGTQGTSNYALGVWQTGDAGYNPLNPYRNSNAFYFLPTEDEWVKAAYWNGTSLQKYATDGNVKPLYTIESNYYNYYMFGDPWAVGSGIQELNGTYDMMGNAWEWCESPFDLGDYSPNARRLFRGGNCVSFYEDLESTTRMAGRPGSSTVGFRVASIPEPATMLLLGLGGMMLRRKK